MLTNGLKIWRVSMGYKDKEKQKEYQKIWYEKKKLEKGFIEKSRLRCRKYKAANKEKINAQRKNYFLYYYFVQKFHLGNL